MGNARIAQLWRRTWLSELILEIKRLHAGPEAREREAATLTRQLVLCRRPAAA